MLETSDHPHFEPTWCDNTNTFTGGLPSWMAPRPASMMEEPESERSMPPATLRPSRPPSHPVIVSEMPRTPTIPPPMRDYVGEIAALQQQLDACVSSMQGMRRRVLQASERDLVALAMVIAERVVGRELATEPGLVVAWAREGIHALVAEDSVRVVVSSDLADAFGAVESWDDDRQVSLSIDPMLAPASCEVRGHLGRVDAGLRERLLAVGDALGVGDLDE